MTPNQVLEQIYPDEVDYLFKSYSEKQQLEEIKRYEGYLWSMRAVAAGMGGETKGGESLYEVYSKELINNIKKLSDIEDDSSSFNVNEAYYEYEKLKDKDNLTVEEEQRKMKLKQQLDEHIDNEISKLKRIQNKQPKK